MYVGLDTRKHKKKSKFSYEDEIYIQSVPRLVDITAGGDFLRLCDQKSYINMCLILDGYGLITA